jgi:hypothetical protein
MIRSILAALFFVNIFYVFAEIPEDIIKVKIEKKKVKKKKPIAIHFTAMLDDTVQLYIKDFDKKIRQKESIPVIKDSTIYYNLKINKLPAGVYLVDIKKENKIVAQYTLLVAIFRNKLLVGQ